MEIFYVSAVFWIAVLILFALLNRRIAMLTVKVEDLEEMQKQKQSGKMTK